MAKLFRVTTVPISVEKLLGKQLTFMNQFFDVTAISADQEYLERVGKELGVKTHTIEMTRKITPIQDLRSLWEMYSYFKGEKPEIVHTHTPKAGLIGMMAAKLAGVKIRLHTVAGLPLMEATGNKRKVLNFVEKLTYGCATKVYPNSQGLYDFILKEKLGKPEKIEVIGNGSSNGIDVSHFDPALFSDEANQTLKQQLGISKDDFVFVFVGRLVKDKGINELINAFKTLQLSNPQPLKLLLLGPLEQDLDPLSQDVLDEIEKNENIISVGFQKDVRPYFAISNCLAFPSYREGFPNVVLQALAMGIPALVSNINGCNEIVKENYNGLIFPPKDESSLLDSMEKILKNDLYNDIQAVSRSSIMIYRQEVIWELLKENYDKLMIS
ncbi:glycosyltransferase family 4 protein [Epilithonimonas sp. JDS]|uniref:glycosyltransferase family 4 protein n=1 Tax=Epilithonimonas sp. JDS TaxID=2902797 RepID=UPI001E479B93|nr:glycosyltransferase family 4 protein [Epilithonimonas sp. JDS]MCD9853806.1 glycosyltransferase family 4 protein [Epilithonimonas sp. JDS]